MVFLSENNKQQQSIKNDIKPMGNSMGEIQGKILWTEILENTGAAERKDGTYFG